MAPSWGRHACVPPGVQDCFFLPQKPYMPLGSLRQQLIFPQAESSSDVAVESDAALRKLAEQVCLPRTLHRISAPALYPPCFPVLSVSPVHVHLRVMFQDRLSSRPGALD